MVGARGLLPDAAEGHQGRGAQRRGRAFLRRPRSQRIDRARHRRGRRAFAHRGTARSSTIEFGRVPVVAVLHGAVVGGGLELAAAAHVRVAETLDLLRAAGGQPRHLCRRRRLGAAAAAHRRLAHAGNDADRPHLRRRGRPGDRPVALSGRPTARASPRASSSPSASPSNAPLTNFAIMHVLPRIAESDPGKRLCRPSR